MIAPGNCNPGIVELTKRQIYGIQVVDEVIGRANAVPDILPYRADTSP